MKQFWKRVSNLNSFGKLNDKRAILNILGCVLKNPALLDEYSLEREDFEVEAFHEILFACIYNLYNKGVQVIDCFAIDSFLSNYEKQYKIFSNNQGIQYVNSAIEMAEPGNFQYYYERLKKFSYLRNIEKKGFDTTYFYNSNEIEPAKQEIEVAKLDKLTIEEIIDTVENMLVINPRMKYTSKTTHKGQTAGQNMRQLKEHLKEMPEFGLPVQSPLLTTISRGARLKKLYMRSSASGGGKTRLAIGDLCGYSIPWFYDLQAKKWVDKGFSEAVLFISTELEADEIQTLMIAYVAGVNEEHILDGKYENGEEERVDQAIKYIEKAQFYIEVVPDFNIQEMKSLIKKYKREKNVLYVSFDYIHMSAKLIAEIAFMSKGMRLREDQILFLFVDELKNLCNTIGIHIDTATQLNGEYKQAKDKDETLLRGAKSMADRLDMGIISLPPTRTELEGIKPILAKMVAPKIPNLIQHIYKVRRGKLTKIRLWQYADLGTCRTQDLFVTTNDYKLIPVEATSIENIEKTIEEHSVKVSDLEVAAEKQQKAAKALFL